MWLAIFGAVIIVSLAGLFYLIAGFHRFSSIKKLGEKHKLLSWAAAVVPVLLIGLFGLINVWSVMIVLIHLFLFWLGCDIAAWFIRRVRKKERTKNYAGAAAIVITALYLSMGWFLAHHVFATYYNYTTDKPLPDGRLRVAEIADLHLGITLDGEEFAQQCGRISAEEPDIVVVAGDFVDDESLRADMITACAALGSINTKYGVYFIYGNHDKGYYGGDYRDFKDDDLRAELQKNGVVILEDEAFLVNDSFYVIGRQDKTETDRLPMTDLTAGLDLSKYMLTIDHQPNAYDEEAAAGADMVLSGHTHGGHIWPAGQIGLLIGANDRVYGQERRGNTEFIVSSGISGWAIPFKTGTISEYVIIDIENK